MQSELQGSCRTAASLSCADFIHQQRPDVDPGVMSAKKENSFFTIYLYSLRVLVCVNKMDRTMSGTDEQCLDIWKVSVSHALGGPNDNYLSASSNIPKWVPFCISTHFIFGTSWNHGRADSSETVSFSLLIKRVGYVILCKTSMISHSLRVPVIQNSLGPSLLLKCQLILYYLCDREVLTSCHTPLDQMPTAGTTLRHL